MTKPKIILLLLLITFAAFSQKKTTSNNPNVKPSKLETQQWIKEKISSYSYNTDSDIKYNYRISFEGNDMIIEDGAWLKQIGESNCSRKLSVIDIDFITFREQESTFHLTINIKEGKKIPIICNNETIGNSDPVTIILEKSFKNDNLPERMTKAFKRLVELYGGKKATNKEAF